MASTDDKNNRQGSIAQEHAGGFLSLSDEQLRSLSRNAVLRECPANLHVLGEGDRSDALYLILSGRVKVYLTDEDGRDFILNEHGPGECFGEMALDGGARSASVITLAPSRFLAVPREDLEGFLRGNPDVAMQLMRQLIGLARHLTEKVKALALASTYQRLAALLQEMSEEDGGVRVVRGRHTHAELSQRIGASREMVTRLMKDLTAGGYVRSEANGLTIAKPLPRKW